MIIRLNVNDYKDRTNVVMALVNNGYKVSVEKEPEEEYSLNRNYWVVIEDTTIAEPKITTKPDNEESGMKKLSDTCFPTVGTENLRFKLKDGRILHGRYDFDKLGDMRWIDDEGLEYGSILVDEWIELEDTNKEENPSDNDTINDIVYEGSYSTIKDVKELVDSLADKNHIHLDYASSFLIHHKDEDEMQVTFKVTYPAKEESGMKKLDNKCFPTVGMKCLRFKLKDGRILHGRYDFNSESARRWIDDDGNEYTSDLVDEWEEPIKIEGDN